MGSMISVNKKKNSPHSFPVIRGTQAGREFYVSMCPLRLLPQLFFNTKDEDPEFRAQRLLNRSRIPKMARYILENKDTYVLPPLTVSVEGEYQYEPFKPEDGGHFRMGILNIPKESKIYINDGQHRHACLEMAIKSNPALEYETIPVVFFVDRGLVRRQQVFADLNRYGVRPSTSLSIFYDHRNIPAKLTRDLCQNSYIFKGLIETERVSLPPRSGKLFPLSSLYFSILEIYRGKEIENFQESLQFCLDFWEEISSHLTEWKLVRESKTSAFSVRQNYIHSHGVVLQAFGRVGHCLLNQSKQEWRTILKGVGNIEWVRGNVRAWEGRAMLGGKIAKSSQNIVLTANYIKKMCGIPLDPVEQNSEDRFLTAKQFD